MKQLVLLPIILILFTVKVKSQDVDLNGKLKFKELELNCSVKSLKISRYRLVDKFGEYSEKLVETSAYSFDDKGRCLYLKRPSHNGLEELTFNYEGECLKGYKSGNQVLAECKCNSDGLVQTKNTLNRMNNFNYTYEYDSRGNIIKITSYGFGSVSSITINTYDNQNREVSSKVYNETGILKYTYGTEYQSTNTGSSISTFTDKNLGNGKSDREESTYKTFNKNGDITYWSSSFHKKDMGSTFYDYVYNSDNSIKTQTSHLETIKTNYTKVEYTKYDSKGNWIEKKVIDHYLGGNNEPTEDVEIFRREIKYFEAYSDSLSTNSTITENQKIERNKLSELNPKNTTQSKYTNGQIKSIGDKLNGEYIEYSPSGQILVKGNYIDGKANGRWLWYYDNGSLRQYFTFKNGFKNGIGVTYSTAGYPKDSITYINDKIDGLHFEFNSVGLLESKSAYSNGIRTGKSFYYFPNGAIRKEETYVNDKLSFVTYYSLDGKIEKQKMFSSEENISREK